MQRSGAEKHSSANGGFSGRIQGPCGPDPSADYTENKAVPALQTDGLQRGGVEALVALEKIERCPSSDDSRIGAVGIDDLIVVYNVVEDHHRAVPTKFHCPVQVVGVVRFI